jgi:hypothetical protein
MLPFRNQLLRCTRNVVIPVYRGSFQGLNCACPLPTCQMGRWCLSFLSMVNSPQPSSESRGIFVRLKDRGISDYGSIKQIVGFQIPQSAFFFADRFGRKTLEQVLRQIERWKRFLKTDFLLLPSQRAEVEKWICQTETMVCNALVQANFRRVGDWDLQYDWMPTGTDGAGSPVFIRSGLRITARHLQTDEVRKALIPGEALYRSDLGANPFQKAFEELRLWETLEKGSLRRHLISARKPQGWPLYTRFIVPHLYEFLAPYYSQRGHYSEKRDTADNQRKALFPKELLDDMLDILRMEHPHAFEKTTVNQLKASIQRHLERKSRSIKSPQ